MNHILPLFAAALICCSCANKPNTDEPDSRVKIEFGEYQSFDSNVLELSSLCLSADGSSLLSVSDDKDEKGGIYNISFDGKTSKMLGILKDLEGITMDPQTKDIYIVVEGEQSVYKVAAPSYKSEELIGKVPNTAADPSGKGFEGITWYKDNTVIIGNQANPTTLYFYSITEKKVTSEIKLSYPTFISDLCYDATGDLLWISDSKSKNIYIAKTDGTLLRTYSIESIVDYGKAEGLTVDRAHNCVWVGCDVTDKVYKIDVKF